MPKDVGKNRYYTAAVPKQSRLQHWIDHFHEEAHEQESQTLVRFAAEYVRLFLDGNLASLPASVAPLVPAKMMEPVGASDEELNAFGDPD